MIEFRTELLGGGKFSTFSLYGHLIFSVPTSLFFCDLSFLDKLDLGGLSL